LGLHVRGKREQQHDKDGQRRVAASCGHREYSFVGRGGKEEGGAAVRGATAAREWVSSRDG
jgi:hypothetical protein